MRYGESQLNRGARTDDGGLGDATEAARTSVQPGKHLHLEVPDFSNAEDGAEPMTTYLHLGAIQDAGIAASPDAPPSTGEDLAAQATSFIDDTRMRDGCPDFVPEAERIAETARLHFKGGWRDHTDGNRITTTRGDKVEIIQGNYRLVVLGRQDDEAGWDFSGGHLSASGITLEGGGFIEYTTAQYGGAWRVVENAEKGDVTTTYHGIVRDTYWGEEVSSTTGSESPTAERPNPVVTDRKWAMAIASYTGSAGLPVPSISDETWAESISSTTNADSISETTTASAITSTTTAGAITDTTTAGVVTSTTIGNIVDTTLGTSESLIVGAESEIIIGNSMEINLGAQESLTLGAVLDITLGILIDIAIAGKISVQIGPSVDISINPRTEKKAARAHSEGDVAKASAAETKASGAYSVLSPVSLLG